MGSDRLAVAARNDPGGGVGALGGGMLKETHTRGTSRDRFALLHRGV